MPPLITLLTDFGNEDGYAAAMKGVILGRIPNTTIVDISHNIPPQDVRSAAFVLKTASFHFPPDTLHVVVVDPDVGTQRRILLLQTPQGRYLAPDNGVLTYVLAANGGDVPAAVRSATPHGTPSTRSIAIPPALTAWSVTNQSLFLPLVSATFHGRDIFAPVAAFLGEGHSTHEVGAQTDTAAVFSLAKAIRDGSGNVRGVVLHIDRFGNLITNLTAADLPSNGASVEIAGHTILELSSSYAGGAGLLAIMGSSGYLEIAVRNGSAAQKLGVARGTAVLVRPG